MSAPKADVSATISSPPDPTTAAEAITALLAARAPPDPAPDLGEWADVYHTIAAAYAPGAPAEVRRTWDVLARARPELLGLLAADGTPWPERTPLSTLPSVPALPPTLLPLPLRPWLVDLADRACIVLEYIAGPALVALGAVVGRALGIRPGRYDDYLIVPNLWGGIIGGPGTMKSYAVAEALKPLARLAAEATANYERRQREAEAKHDRIEAEITAIKTQMVQAAKGGKPGAKPTETPTLDALEQLLATKKEELAAQAVVERRFLTQDATTEKLAELLVANPRGLLVARDELAGWLRTLDRPGDGARPCTDGKYCRRHPAREARALYHRGPLRRRRR